MVCFAVVTHKSQLTAQQRAATASVPAEVSGTVTIGDPAEGVSARDPLTVSHEAFSTPGLFSILTSYFYHTPFLKLTEQMLCRCFKRFPPWWAQW